MSVEVYRLRLSKGTSTSHSPDWRLYENKDEFVHDMTEAMIIARGRTLPRHEMGRDSEKRYAEERSWWLACKAWSRHILRVKDEPFGINKIIGAEMLVDGEWVDVKPHLVPPHVLWNENPR